MKTILVTAYAINPYKGSEDGTGWNYVLQIARHNKVVVVTRENNLPHIKKYQEEHQLEMPHVAFYGFDLPKWARFWKRGGNGALLYFYLWQYFIVNFVRRNKLQFDIAHNLNFHTDWIPTFLYKLKKPVVWGPVGHHPKVPKGYYHKGNSTLVDRVKNTLIWTVKLFAWRCDPFFARAKKKVAKVICINSEVEAMMRLSESKIVRFFSVGSEPVEALQKQENDDFVVLSIGRLVPLKGFDITLASFHLFLKSLSPVQREKAKLIIIGKGKMKESLQNYINEHKLNAHVELKEWMDRSTLMEYYAKSKVFLFPSHEGAGMVVPEAMSYGMPVLCFDNCGPGAFVNATCGLKIPYTNYTKSIDGFASALQALFHSKALGNRLSIGARKRFKDSFLWNSKGDVLKEVYTDLLSNKH